MITNIMHYPLKQGVRECRGSSSRESIDLLRPVPSQAGMAAKFAINRRFMDPDQVDNLRLSYDSLS